MLVYRMHIHIIYENVMWLQNIVCHYLFQTCKFAGVRSGVSSLTRIGLITVMDYWNGDLTVAFSTLNAFHKITFEVK